MIYPCTYWLKSNGTNSSCVNKKIKIKNMLSLSDKYPSLRFMLHYWGRFSRGKDQLSLINRPSDVNRPNQFSIKDLFPFIFNCFPNKACHTKNTIIPRYSTEQNGETRVAYDWTMWSVGVKTIKDVITYRIYFCFILYI